jgi:hypothetical protein
VVDQVENDLWHGIKFGDDDWTFSNHAREWVAHVVFELVSQASLFSGPAPIDEGQAGDDDVLRVGVGVFDLRHQQPLADRRSIGHGAMWKSKKVAGCGGEDLNKDHRSDRSISECGHNHPGLVVKALQSHLDLVTDFWSRLSSLTVLVILVA